MEQKIFFKSKDGLRLCAVWHIPSKLTTKITGEITDVGAAIKQVKTAKIQRIGLLGASVGGGIVTLYAENQKEVKCLCL